MKNENEMNDDKVWFSDLSIWLKILVVLGWITAGFSLILFVIGFIIGTYRIFP